MAMTSLLMMQWEDEAFCEAPEKHPSTIEHCPKRQLYDPRHPYPAWDYDWDSRMSARTSYESLRQLDCYKTSKQSGTTRHIILIRHGQYDMTHPNEDEKCTLTILGRRQALRTGQRLALLTEHLTGELSTNGTTSSPIRIRAIHQSNMARARETAEIIASQIRNAELQTPDPMLNEAIPCPMIPVRPDVPNADQEIDENQLRIEHAFRKYFWRIPTTNDDHLEEHERQNEAGQFKEQQHEFEVIVGHANVIRYFVCRALQIPPEAWLRMSIFNCSITYITIQPNGYCAIRLLGDTGHLPYEETTFSGSYGWNWS